MTELIKQVSELKDRAELTHVFDTDKTQTSSNIMQHLFRS